VQSGYSSQDQPVDQATHSAGASMSQNAGELNGIASDGTLWHSACYVLHVCQACVNISYILSSAVKLIMLT